MKRLLLLCAMIWSVATLSAQLSNGEVYRTLWQEHLAQSVSYAKVSGQMIAPFFPDFQADSTSRLRLQVLKPEVEYKLLADKRVKRKIEIPYNVKDSLIESFRLTYADTLSKENFKQIHKQSKEDLRGESPTLRAKWLRPISILAFSVGGIIALFYVRSS